ncbi:MAG: helix-turn-helix domain-containing protein [Cyclobacteriaceae bacterium]
MFEYKGHVLGAVLTLSDNFQRDRDIIAADHKGLIHIIWNRNEASVKITVDGLDLELQPSQIITTTYLQIVTFPDKKSPLTAFCFNREFYCINDHDHEVSCNGIIFFGTQEIPIISLNEKETQSFDLLHKVFVEEFKNRDQIQGEMLQMLLKRLIIKCTRLAKDQLITKTLDNAQIDIIRRFNVLVDLNYKVKKQVGEYAELLNKSPKTLSNLFSTFNQKTPLQIIHERIILEAKKQLLYSDKTAKEIAYDLGFDDDTAFSKLFKKMTNNTPMGFKKSVSLDQLIHK